MTFSEKSETLKPWDAYFLHLNFWGALYVTCCGLTSNTPIVDVLVLGLYLLLLFSPWVT
jgi:hypothetical protein